MNSLRTQVQVLCDYELARLLIAKKKCQLGWLQETKFLGFMVNTLTSQLSIIKFRRDKLFFAINICLENSLFPVKKLVAILGMIASIKPIFGPFCRLLCFHLFGCLNQRANWNSSIMINDLAKNELKLWLKIFDRFNSKPI